jgi:hypothetical protein
LAEYWQTYEAPRVPNKTQQNSDIYILAYCREHEASWGHKFTRTQYNTPYKFPQFIKWALNKSCTKKKIAPISRLYFTQL